MFSSFLLIFSIPYSFQWLEYRPTKKCGYYFLKKEITNFWSTKILTNEFLKKLLYVLYWCFFFLSYGENKFNATFKSLVLFVIWFCSAIKLYRWPFIEFCLDKWDVHICYFVCILLFFYIIAHFSFPLVCGSPCWWCKSSPYRRRVARVLNTFRIRSFVATSSPSAFNKWVLINSPMI